MEPRKISHERDTSDGVIKAENSTNFNSSAGYEIEKGSRPMTSQHLNSNEINHLDGEYPLPGSQALLPNMQMKVDGKHSTYYKNVGMNDMLSDGAIDPSVIDSNQKSEKGLLMSS